MKKLVKLQVKLETQVCHTQGHVPRPARFSAPCGPHGADETSPSERGHARPSRPDATPHLLLSPPQSTSTTFHITQESSEMTMKGQMSCGLTPSSSCRLRSSSRLWEDSSLIRK